MLALHLLQSALVHINTMLVERILREPAWANRLTNADRSPRSSGPTSTPTANSRSTWTANSTWTRPRRELHGLVCPW